MGQFKVRQIHAEESSLDSIECIHVNASSVTQMTHLFLIKCFPIFVWSQIMELGGDNDCRDTMAIVLDFCGNVLLYTELFKVYIFFQFLKPNFTLHYIAIGPLLTEPSL